MSDLSRCFVEIKLRLVVGLQRAEAFGFETAFGIGRFVAAGVEELDEVDAHFAGFAAGVDPRDEFTDGVGDAFDREFPIILFDGVREDVIDADYFLAWEIHGFDLVEAVGVEPTSFTEQPRVTTCLFHL